MKSKIPGALRLSFIKPKSNLRKLINGVIVPLSYKISLKRLKMEYILPSDGSPEIDKFYCDWRVYKQILFCVLENAVTGSNENSIIKIRIEIKRCIQDISPEPSDVDV
jgi:hypothetical protein